MAYLESSGERDRPGALPKRVKSLDKMTEGCKVWLIDTVESDQLDSDDSGASETCRKGGVWLNTDRSPIDLENSTSREESSDLERGKG